MALPLSTLRSNHNQNNNTNDRLFSNENDKNSYRKGDQPDLPDQPVNVCVISKNQNTNNSTVNIKRKFSSLRIPKNYYVTSQKNENRKSADNSLNTDLSVQSEMNPERNKNNKNLDCHRTVVPLNSKNPSGMLKKFGKRVFPLILLVPTCM